LVVKIGIKSNHNCCNRNKSENNVTKNKSNCKVNKGKKKKQ